MNLPQELHPEHTGRISRLWRSEALQAAYGRRNRFQLVQCAKYFLDRCESVLEEDYVPNDQDIVQTRVKTTGIVEHDFEVKLSDDRMRRLILVRCKSECVSVIATVTDAPPVPIKSFAIVAL